MHLIPAAGAHIGVNRARGFSLGGSAYVSFVDDDDIVVPGAYPACLNALAINPGAVGAYSDELIIDDSGGTIGNGISTGVDWSITRQICMMPLIHHGVVMRRSAVMPILPEISRWPHFPEQVLFGLLAKIGPWIHIPMIGYKWRRHPGQAINSRGAEIDDVVRFLARSIWL